MENEDDEENLRIAIEHSLFSKKEEVEAKSEVKKRMKEIFPIRKQTRGYNTTLLHT